MKVRLKERWNGYVPGSIVSVSDERAEYLVNKIKVGKLINSQKPEKVEEKKPVATRAKK